MLSILIPCSEREENLNISLLNLLEDNREFEIIISLNSSEDRRHLISNRIKNDKRVIIIPNFEDGVKSMRDNWERAVNASSKEWIAVIGDDDVIFPEVLDVIKVIRKQDEVIEAFTWNKLLFTWPGECPKVTSPNIIPMSTDFKKVKSELSLKSNFEWVAKARTPGMGTSIYHGAIKRTLLERMKLKYGSHFVDEVVDYDYGYRVLLNTENAYWSERPLSIMGSCNKSNSNGVNDVQKFIRLMDKWDQENGNGQSEIFEMNQTAGLVAVVYNFQKRVIKNYGLEYNINVDNLIGKIADDCATDLTQDGCELRKQIYIKEVRRLFPGRDYERIIESVEWRDASKSSMTRFKGLLTSNNIVVNSNEFENINDFAKFCSRILCPVEFLGGKVNMEYV